MSLYDDKYIELKEEFDIKYGNKQVLPLEAADLKIMFLAGKIVEILVEIDKLKGIKR